MEPHFSRGKAFALTSPICFIIGALEEAEISEEMHESMIHLVGVLRASELESTEQAGQSSPLCHVLEGARQGEEQETRGDCSASGVSAGLGSNISDMMVVGWYAVI